jgi:hypothetical protein
LPDGTDGKIVTLPRERIGQDPCGRWSHCGRYIAYVKIPHAGSWRVHSPICIVRVADGATITLSPFRLVLNQLPIASLHAMEKDAGLGDGSD